MLLLVATTDKLQLVTGAAIPVDVHASFMDLAGGSVTPGKQNTAITAATTTDIVAAPGASTVRNVKTLHVRNKHASAPVDVTVVYDQNGTDFEQHKATLPGDSMLQYVEGRGFELVGPDLNLSRPYHGKIISPYGGGDPNTLMRELQNAGHVNATPTNITTAIARCSGFRPQQPITINNIRWYGVGATTNVYRAALYRYSDLARLTAELPFTTVANAWGLAAVSPGVTLEAGELYFIAVAVNATGTTAGVACVGTTTSATVGQIQSAPGALPGSLDLDAGFFEGFFFQFAVSSGALPNPANALVQPAVWTGGMPAFFLDAA